MLKAAAYPQLKALQNSLHSHKIYGAVRGEKNMRMFMENHVFAVWDFMLLLKYLQRNLTCVDNIWVPPLNNSTARFINQIVVGEETDLHPNGKGSASHFELYLQAMKEVGADTSAITTFIQKLRAGVKPHIALKETKAPDFTQEFVLNTLSSLNQPTSYVAAQFFYGRQDPIPQMFQRFVENFQHDKKCEFLKYYLKRHVQVDGEEHGPLSQKLIEELAEKEDPNYDLIVKGAINAVQYRIKLWDGIYDRLV